MRPTLGQRPSRGSTACPVGGGAGWMGCSGCPGPCHLQPGAWANVSPNIDRALRHGPLPIGWERSWRTPKDMAPLLSSERWEYAIRYGRQQ